MRKRVCGGVPEKEKIDRWMLGSGLNYAEVLMTILAKPQAQDQMDGCRSGLEHQVSKQKGLWIVLPLEEDRELSISAGTGERNLHRLPIPKISA